MSGYQFLSLSLLLSISISLSRRQAVSQQVVALFFATLHQACQSATLAGIPLTATQYCYTVLTHS